MKRMFLLLTLLAPCLGFAGVPADTARVDVTGLQLTNYCAGETVTVTEGDLAIVFRPDFGGDVNGVHILNKVAGSFTAIGNSSGSEYRVNIAGQSPILMPGVSISNFVNGSGVANLLIHIEQIDLTHPGEGISQVKAVIVFVIDGTGTGNQRVQEVSMACVGG
jgi:hypothetical protein